jgi:hypothetical protein
MHISEYRLFPLIEVEDGIPKPLSKESEWLLKNHFSGNHNETRLAFNLLFNNKKEPLVYIPKEETFEWPRKRKPNAFEKADKKLSKEISRIKKSHPNKYKDYAKP